uniref:Protein MIS12 homolog n=1 Tax=Dunaliella tertiolecta TaxID=3047 RepID=A0A7S3QRG6_DUNTE|mmetsp:Transcript_2891/g.7538  ORF Transcript_2891/g.7538 Transcript_2891/m.7538 type:complete len:238 (+) Transcript_2891:94-807(+)|eukprot:CAMPEP_0202342522 /NCGR_PEP_ID=MMETSP1126-20121109/3052_1 /ASSEMBLY_ACC=CAM_ASM_000457 /TAXON_ID=3047 /ORGANISM="Dunaliella tertiolecta, Strain CCMP1320" /LENGTH=237 /DNA_ID=CAMNT_0048933493 /DNA_START=90 /DNA_END=803 /DNA_ORIENTATION=+
MEDNQLGKLSEADTAAFIADASNAVQDYCADGIDAFEGCLAQATALDPAIREEIKQGSELLYKDLTTRVTSSLSLFEQLCKSAVFSVPAQALLPQLDALSAPPVPSSSESEEEVDQKLNHLRQQVLQMNAECQQLKAQTSHLGAEVARHGDMSSYQALATTAATNKDRVLADVSAIAHAAQQLQPLLEKASNLRTQREPLAVRQTANLPGDWRTSQQVKTTGSLEDLQLLNKLLQSQ